MPGGIRPPGDARLTGRDAARDTPVLPSTGALPMLVSGGAGMRHLDELPVLKPEHAVHARGKIDIVGRHQRGHAGRPDESGQFVEHTVCGVGI